MPSVHTNRFQFKRDELNYLTLSTALIELIATEIIQHFPSNVSFNVTFQITFETDRECGPPVQILSLRTFIIIFISPYQVLFE